MDTHINIKVCIHDILDRRLPEYSCCITFDDENLIPELLAKSKMLKHNIRLMLYRQNSVMILGL